jgi:hypothetical protein
MATTVGAPWAFPAGRGGSFTDLPHHVHIGIKH